MARPKLSLCMIVRDEAELLPRFLEHVAGLWDELLVVDTGSEDHTVALLEQAGARVLHAPWTDDFSAARNVGLAEARGEWILVLDADEMVSAEAAAQIRALLEDAGAGAATLRMRNQLPHGHHRSAPLLRLFRNAPTVRFRFPIHEEIATSVRARLRATGRRMVALDGVVEHLGYVRDHAAARDKKSRDLKLLERCLTTDPDDLYAHFKRLELARFWDDRRLLTRAAEVACESLSHASATALRQHHYAGELLVLIAQGRHGEEHEEALAWLTPFETRISPSASYHLWRGQLREILGDQDGARSDFEACMEQKDPRQVQLATTRPLMGLCRLAMAREEWARANGLARRALEHTPRDPEALVAVISIARVRGGPEEVTAFVHAHEKNHGRTAELQQALQLAGRSG